MSLIISFVICHFLCLDACRDSVFQAARSVIQTLLGVWLFGDLLTTYVLPFHKSRLDIEVPVWVACGQLL